MESLEGLATGDAFGDRFFDLHFGFDESRVAEVIAARTLPSAPWRFTDDTQMALSVITVLRAFGRIDQGILAADFAAHYEPARGYGPSMHEVLRRLRDGSDWAGVAGGSHGGQGSYGTGAAMRVAPLGAYFADDLDRVVEQARLSAEVTHTHPEGVAGAIAVAAAAALAWRFRLQGRRPSTAEYLEMIGQRLPPSEVRMRLRWAAALRPGTAVSHAGEMLGVGWMVSAQDTVPFALWCAATFLDDYEEAMWQTVSGLGDRDTNCAIVGGIVAASPPLGAWRVSHSPTGTWPTPACLPRPGVHR